MKPKQDIYTLAKFGDFDMFIESFNIEEINKKSSIGSGLLHYAVSGKQFDIALFLIKKGIDVNLTNSDGQTVQHLLAINQNLYLTKQLLEHGLDINIKDNYGNNAVWSAVFNCKGISYELVDILMQASPDILSKNNAGQSPLDFAIKIGDKKLINLLTSTK